MRIVCAAVNCKYSSEDEDSSNVIFINFPNDDTAKVWAKFCGRSDLITKPNAELHSNYYICSHHIADHYYISKPVPIILAENTIPTLFETNLTIKTEDSNNILDNSQHLQEESLTYCDMDVERAKCHITKRLFNLCRICGISTPDGIDIFAAKGKELKLREKINLHTPVSIDREDRSLPQKVCVDCCNKLEITHLVVVSCLKTDLQLKRFLNIGKEREYETKYHTLVDECLSEIAREMQEDKPSHVDVLIHSDCASLATYETVNPKTETCLRDVLNGEYSKTQTNNYEKIAENISSNRNSVIQTNSPFRDHLNEEYSKAQSRNYEKVAKNFMPSKRKTVIQKQICLIDLENEECFKTQSNNYESVAKNVPLKRNTVIKKQIYLIDLENEECSKIQSDNYENVAKNVVPLERSNTIIQTKTYDPKNEKCFETESNDYESVAEDVMPLELKTVNQTNTCLTDLKNEKCSKTESNDYESVAEDVIPLELKTVNQTETCLTDLKNEKCSKTESNNYFERNVIEDVPLERNTPVKLKIRLRDFRNEKFSKTQSNNYVSVTKNVVPSELKTVIPKTYLTDLKNEKCSKTESNNYENAAKDVMPLELKTVIQTETCFKNPENEKCSKTENNNYGSVAEDVMPSELKTVNKTKTCLMDLKNEICSQTQNNNYEIVTKDVVSPERKTSLQLKICLRNLRNETFFKTQSNSYESIAKDMPSKYHRNTVNQTCGGVQNNEIVTDEMSQIQQDKVLDGNQSILRSQCQTFCETQEIFENHSTFYDEVNNVPKYITRSKAAEIRKHKNGQINIEESSKTCNKGLDYDHGNRIRKRKRCGHCREVYYKRKDLLNHFIESHNGHLLFKCSTCDKTYAKLGSLYVHEGRIHKVKKYFCDRCGKYFKHSNSLSKHKKAHLDESREKKYTCEICGSAFRSRFLIQQHMNLHFRNKSYLCDQCGKTFYRSTHLWHHKFTHESNRYVCLVCGATYNRRGNLSTHMKRHNKGKINFKYGIYTCSVCAYKCKFMSELKLHRRSHITEERVDNVRNKDADKM